MQPYIKNPVLYMCLLYNLYIQWHVYDIISLHIGIFPLLMHLNIQVWIIQFTNAEESRIHDFSSLW